VKKLIILTPAILFPWSYLLIDQLQNLGKRFQYPVYPIFLLAAAMAMGQMALRTSPPDLRRKNLGVGMEVVAALKKRGKSVRWLITGAPDPHNPESMKYYRMLVSLRKKLKITDEVIFLSERFEDRISHADLCALYRISDMLLFPSDREGFGLPVLEAGLAGLIVVISDIPALREIAKRDAVYIHLGDSASIVAKNIIAASNKRPEYILRKKIMRKYAWEIVFEEHILPAILTPEKLWATLSSGAGKRDSGKGK